MSQKSPPNPSINQNEFHEVSEFQEDKLLTLSNVEGHGGGVAEGHWIEISNIPLIPNIARRRKLPQQALCCPK